MSTPIDDQPSPDLPGRTAPERVGRFLDTFQSGGSRGPNVMTVAGRVSEHRDIALTVDDLRQLVSLPHRILDAARRRDQYAVADLASSADLGQLGETVKTVLWLADQLYDTGRNHLASEVTR